MDLQTLKESVDLRTVVALHWGEAKEHKPRYDIHYSRWRDDGRSPSFTVYADGYRDFGGDGEHGSVLDFIMRERGFDFKEAVEWLEDYTGNKTERMPARPRPAAAPRQADITPPDQPWQKAMHQFIDDSHKRLMNEPRILAYLQEARGLSIDTIKTFKLGFNRTWTKTPYIEDGSGKAVKAAPGIVIPWQTGGDVWAVRIRTITGSFARFLNVVEASGKNGTLDKYLSVKGSRQARTMFNGDSLVVGQDALIVEGEFDTMLAGQTLGIAVVTRGSSTDHNNIRPQWLEKLKLCGTVYSLMDTDTAGQKATENLSKQIGNHKPLLLPGGKDFTEYVIDYEKDGSKVLEVSSPRPVAQPEEPPAPPPMAGNFPDEPPPRQHFSEPSEAELKAQAANEKERLRKEKERERNRRKKEMRKMPLTDRVSKTIDDMMLPAATADITCDMRYISDYDMHALLDGDTTHYIVRSPIGTGKTEIVTRIIKHLTRKLGYNPRVLVLNHRQSLSRNLARRFEHLGFISYKDIQSNEPEAYAAANKLIMSYDSVHKLFSKGNMDVVPYDLVIIDEIEQFHSHVGGATMKHNAASNYTLVKSLVKSCGYFFGLDAHASDKSMEWLRKIQPGAKFLINAHVVPRKTMTIYRERTALITEAFILADQNRGPVLMPTNSVSTARQLHMMAVNRYGEDAVQLIYQDNAHYPETQAFINDINERIKGVRMLIYSPSLGTGVDITTPVVAVMGVFYKDPITTDDMHQMMGRARDAEIRSAYVTDVIEGQREADWIMIYAQYRNEAKRTAAFADFKTHGLKASNKTHDEILSLLSQFIADRNKMMNEPLVAFVKRAQQDGFTIAYNESSKVKPVSEALRNAGDVIKAYDRQRTHEVHAVDSAEYESKLMDGDVDEDVQYGYERWQIEDTAGMELDIDGVTVQVLGMPVELHVYDDLHKKPDRLALRRFTDIVDDLDALKDIDRSEAEQNRILTQRGHRSRAAAFFHNMIRLAYGVDRIEDALHIKLTANDISNRLTDYLHSNIDTLRGLFGWRPGHHSANVVAMFRLILKRVGLVLDGQQVMALGQRFIVYTLNEESLMKMLAYSQSRLQHIQQGRSGDITTNRQNIIKPERSNHADIPLSKPPEGSVKHLMALI